jgi:autotransporter strand-loop-strand O-heptosyltransferase
MNPKITVSYCDGCHVKIVCPDSKSYRVIIFDDDIQLINIVTNGNEVVSHDSFRTFYRFINYKVNIYIDDNIIFTDTMDLNGKRVKINFDSTALGDCISWMAQVDRFQQLHNCELYVSCNYKHLFENSYTNISFTDVESIPNKEQDTIIPGLGNSSCKNLFCFYNPCHCYYASFELGFYPVIPELRTKTLSKVASDFLGLSYEEKKPKIWIENSERLHKKPYVCISVQTTAQCKYWNNKTGWQKVVDYLISIGYDVLCIDKFDHYGKDGFINSAPLRVINKTGDFAIQERITDILHCDFFIGLSSGLSWLAWAIEKPVIMISGFSDPISEFSNTYRIINRNVCNSCFNDLSVPNHNENGWSYCPRDKDFECSKEISSEMVIEKINQLIETLI